MYIYICKLAHACRKFELVHSKIDSDIESIKTQFLRFWKLNTIWSTDSNEHFDMIKNLVSQHMFIAYAAEFIVKRYAWA